MPPKYPSAYCLELDSILPPDRARDAHSSFLNPEPNKNFTFYCPEPNCGCEFKGVRIHRWDKKNGTAYYGFYNNDAKHSEKCKYYHFNSEFNKSGNTVGGQGIEIHKREVLYPSMFSTLEENNNIYEFDLNTTNLTQDELLHKIALANENLVNWNEIPISDLRIIIEAYHYMNNEEKNNNFLSINNANSLRYSNCFSAIKWLPNSDGLYPHIYFGKIKNQTIKEEDNFYSFYLDWNDKNNTYNKKSFEICIQKNLTHNNYLNELFNENLKGKKWKEAYFYVIDPIFEINKNIKVYPNNNLHFVVRVID